MSDLRQSQRDFLKHLHGGGLVALAIYGKKEEVVEVISRPTCMFAGIKGIAELQELGLVRYGDPSPYKSGRSLPIVLTDAGKAAVAV